jgi:hypothetical protein
LKKKDPQPKPYIFRVFDCSMAFNEHVNNRRLHREKTWLVPEAFLELVEIEND